MKRIKVLTKYFLKNSFEGMIGKSKKSTIFIVLMLLCSISVLSIPFTTLILEGYEQLKGTVLEKTILDVILYSGSSIVCFLGIYTVMNIFYFTDDTMEILPLPFKGREIVLAKFITVLINMYFYTAIIVPPLIVYGVKSNAGIIYYLYVLLIFILQPVIPMVLASLICMILMSFTSLSKHKDAFKMFTGCISLVLIILFNMVNTNSDSSVSMSDRLFATLSKADNEKFNLIGSIFISDKFSSVALLNSSDITGLKYMALSIITSLIIFAVYYSITGNIYLKGIIGSSESNGKRQDILKNADSRKVIKTRSILKALVYKDIKIIFRTPQFFINCVAMLIYMPAIMCMSFFRGEGLEWVRNIVSVPGEYGSQIVAGAFILGGICVFSGGAANTSLSREGKDIMVSMYLPLDHKTILKSKIISSLIVNELGAVISCMVFIFLKADILLILSCTLSSSCAILIVSMAGIYMDFKWPRLEWENEKAMLKNNYTVFITMFIIFISSVIIFIISNFVNNYLVMTFICVVFSSTISYLLKARIDKLSIKFWKSKMIG